MYLLVCVRLFAARESNKARRLCEFKSSAKITENLLVPNIFIKLQCQVNGGGSPPEQWDARVRCGEFYEPIMDTVSTHIARTQKTTCDWFKEFSSDAVMSKSPEPVNSCETKGWRAASYKHLERSLPNFPLICHGGHRISTPSPEPWGLGWLVFPGR